MNDLNATRNGTEDGGVPMLNAVIIYDDIGLAEEVFAMLLRSARQPEAGAQWRVKLWRMDEFLAPEKSDAAMKQATAANLMVLAVDKPLAVPSQLMQQLEIWATDRRGPDAALAVFIGGKKDVAASVSSPSDLQRLAEKHGLTFISDESAPPHDKPAVFEYALNRHPTFDYSLTAPRSDGVTHDNYNYNHWGINE